jgi:hypothetical protein
MAQRKLLEMYSNYASRRPGTTKRGNVVERVGGMPGRLVEAPVESSGTESSMIRTDVEPRDRS